jgi:hypothetical protein
VAQHLPYAVYLGYIIEKFFQYLFESVVKHWKYFFRIFATPHHNICGESYSSIFWYIMIYYGNDLLQLGVAGGEAGIEEFRN